MPNRVARITLVCKQCSGSYQVRPKQLLRGPDRGQYCSMACRGLSMRARVTLQCDHCETRFERCDAEVERRTSGLKWCSIECQKAYWDAHRISYPKIGARHTHRIVAEKMVGRRLRSDEIVHHKNENKQDFSEHNLAVIDRAEHARIHFHGAKR